MSFMCAALHVSDYVLFFLIVSVDCLLICWLLILCICWFLNMVILADLNYYLRAKDCSHPYSLLCFRLRKEYRVKQTMCITKSAGLGKCVL